MGDTDRDAAVLDRRVYGAPFTAAAKAAADQAATAQRPLSERELEDRSVRMSAVSLAIQAQGDKPNPGAVLLKAREIEDFVNPPPKAPPPPQPAIPIRYLQEAQGYMRGAPGIGVSLTLELTTYGVRIFGTGRYSASACHLSYLEMASSTINPLLAAMAMVLEQVS